MENTISSVSKVSPSSSAEENLLLSLADLQIKEGSDDIQCRIHSFMMLEPLEIVFLADDEIGSQYLQDSLSLTDFRIVDSIFGALFGFVSELMSDQFGHRVFAKLIQSCNYDQLQLIALKITSRDDLFLKSSLDPHGSSSIKQLIKVLSKSPLIDFIVSSLNRLFKHMMITKLGSSIILHCLQTLTNNDNDKIYLAALEDYDKVSRHEKGCVSMKSFIDEMRGARRRQILHLICMNSACLSKDPYGNFVVQHVIDLENPELIKSICSALRGKFADLSMSKEGSYVVEKILQFRNFIEYVVYDFLCSGRIREVANNRYGNYVIQRVLKETMRADGSLFQRLVMKIQEEDIDSLRFGYGKNVYKFIKACGVPALDQLRFI